MMMRVLRELRNEGAQTDDEVVVEEGCQNEDLQAVRAGEARAEAICRRRQTATREAKDAKPTLAGERGTFFVRDMMVRLPARAASTVSSEQRPVGGWLQACGEWRSKPTVSTSMCRGKDASTLRAPCRTSRRSSGARKCTSERGRHMSAALNVKFGDLLCLLWPVQTTLCCHLELGGMSIVLLLTPVNFCRWVLLASCLQVPDTITFAETSEYCKFV